jgi:hypothetical protein
MVLKPDEVNKLINLYDTEYDMHSAHGSLFANTFNIRRQCGSQADVFLRVRLLDGNGTFVNRGLNIDYNEVITDRKRNIMLSPFTVTITNLDFSRQGVRNAARDHQVG